MVTKTVNYVSFLHSIPLGSVVTIEAKVTRVFSSSLEVYADVFVCVKPGDTRELNNGAIFTFVALNMETHKPIKNLAKIKPESDLEKERYLEALVRR